MGDPTTEVLCVSHWYYIYKSVRNVILEDILNAGKVNVTTTNVNSLNI